VEGTLIHDEKLDVLYQALWRPAKEGEYDEPRIKFPDIAAAPVASQPIAVPGGAPGAPAPTATSPAAAAPGKYRHPHFSGSAEAVLKREGETDGVFKYKKDGKLDKPAAPPPPGVISKNALRNKKRRENKKAAKADGEADGEDNADDNQTTTTTTTTSDTPAKPCACSSLRALCVRGCGASSDGVAALSGSQKFKT
jgi:hypothetical protein